MQIKWRSAIPVVLFAICAIINITTAFYDIPTTKIMLSITAFFLGMSIQSAIENS